MTRKIGRKTRSLKAINSYVRKGYGANEIQRRLQKRNLGMRRKNILTEIRLITKKELELRERQRYIPKKYRKKLIAETKRELNAIFRACVVMNNVPITSRPFSRNYLGFRVCGFSINQSDLNNKIGRLKDILLREIESYVGYRQNDWWWDSEIGIEYANLISVSNAIFLNGKWIFRVEKEGRELREKSGVL